METNDRNRVQEENELGVETLSEWEESMTPSSEKLMKIGATN